MFDFLKRLITPKPDLTDTMRQAEFDNLKFDAALIQYENSRRSLSLSTDYDFVVDVQDSIERYKRMMDTIAGKELTVVLPYRPMRMEKIPDGSKLNFTLTHNQ